MNLKKVVIAVDLEDDSLKCLSQIRSFPIPRESAIHLVHVFELSFMSFDLLPVPRPTPDDYLMIEQVILDKLQGVKNLLGLEHHQNVLLKCLIASNARQEFLNYADKEKATLVVAASKEREGFQGLFESSFTAFLNKFSTSSLLILRPEK